MSNFVETKVNRLKQLFKDTDAVIILKNEKNQQVNFYYYKKYLFSYYMSTGTIHCDFLKYRDKQCDMTMCLETYELCLSKIRENEQLLRDQLEFHVKKANELRLRLKDKGDKSFKITMSNTYYVTASDKEMARGLFEKRLVEGRIEFRSYNQIIVEEVVA